MGWNWPWAARARQTAERKSGGYGFVALHAQGEALWTRGDYAALAREGFMRNPVVHRAVRMAALLNATFGGGEGAAADP